MTTCDITIYRHAEAMADILEDLVWCEQTPEMIEKGREVWQKYVDWHAEWSARINRILDQINWPEASS